MPIPKVPSYMTMPNNFKELLGIQRGYFRKVGEGLTNITKVTNLTSKRVKDISKGVKEVTKTAKGAKKITDLLKKGNFKGVNPKLGNAIGFALNLASIGLSFMTINQLGQLQEVQLRIDGIEQRDLSTAFAQAMNNRLNLRIFREEFNRFISQYKQDKDKLGANISANLQQSNRNRQLSEEAKQQANDALYEARAGREKQTVKIDNIATRVNDLFGDVSQLVGNIGQQNAELANRAEVARKIGNDALYEARQNRKILQERISLLSFDLNSISQIISQSNIRLGLAAASATQALDLAKKALQTKTKPGPPSR